MVLVIKGIGNMVFNMTLDKNIIYYIITLTMLIILTLLIKKQNNDTNIKKLEERNGK